MRAPPGGDTTLLSMVASSPSRCASSRQRVSVRVGSAGAISSTSCLVAASAVRPRAAMITFHSVARETATVSPRGAGLLPEGAERTLDLADLDRDRLAAREAIRRLRH